MFPDKDKSYLSEVRRNKITLNDTIDDILGMFRSSSPFKEISLKKMRRMMEMRLHLMTPQTRDSVVDN